MAGLEGVHCNQDTLAGTNGGRIRGCSLYNDSACRRFIYIVLGQWINQSFNALVNYTNRNAKSDVTGKQIAIAYVSATSGAVAVAAGMNLLVEVWEEGHVWAYVGGRRARVGGRRARVGGRRLRVGGRRGVCGWEVGMCGWEEGHVWMGGGACVGVCGWEEGACGWEEAACGWEEGCVCVWEEGCVWVGGGHVWVGGGRVWVGGGRVWVGGGRVWVGGVR